MTQQIDGEQIQNASIPAAKLVDGGAVGAGTVGAAQLDATQAAAMRAVLQVDLRDSKTADLPSTATLDLDALTLTGDFTDVTGTTTVTAITLSAGREHTVRFLGALTLTHNAATLILPGAANYVTAAGDVFVFRGITGGVVCVGVTRAAGVAVVTKAYASAPATITSAASSSFTHGLGLVPSIVALQLVCVTAEQGYSIADVLIVPAGSASNRGPSVTVTSAAVVVRHGSDANAFQVANKTTGATVALTNANWNLVVRAYG